ncbi:hypothetical protein HUW62_02025 [Myxococcus sp. AM011]|uniref:hypothetical protein n=1 Tax=Myxococcus sp. AM011 TaxID=2745200 RepID=UPI00159545D0|nr:hypothetical protein [Myxococcus sp. AM011]NVJ20016.1 hypothetical protein [Myxococcus sp. AM011]
MSSRNVVLPLCLALFACHSEGEPVTPPLDGDSCYEHVRRLSAHDRVLSTRLDHKSRAAKEAQDAARFVSVMLDSRENGDWYACGMTRAWVTEVFEGLERQYSEYRIYQSYADAYSLSAWLSDSTEGLFEPDTGELMVWRGLQAAVNQFLAQISTGQASLDNLDALPADWRFALPYYESVRDADEAFVLAGFTPAWERYGKGRVVPPAEFFDDYLVKLGRPEVYFRENDHLRAPFPEEIWNTWMELHAAPNPLHHPGLPHDLVTDLLLGDRDYRLEVLDVVLPGDERALRDGCAENALILDAAILRP